MSYTFQRTTEIDYDAFDRIFNSSISALKLNHNFKSESDTDLKKKQEILINFQLVLLGEKPGFLWEERDGDHILSYNLGGMLQTDANGFHTFVLDFSMFGPDANGSKSYLYSTAYTQAGIDFWKSMFVNRLLMRFLNTDSGNTAYQNALARQATVVSQGGGTFTDGVVMEWDFS